MKSRLQCILVFSLIVACLFLPGCETKDDYESKLHPTRSISQSKSLKVLKPTTNVESVPDKHNEQGTKVELDKKYDNQIFKFEVMYPGIWSTYEEPYNNSLPDQGFYIYLDNDQNNYVNVFGQVSGINIPEQGMEISQFANNDGIIGKKYCRKLEGFMDIYIIFDRVGAHVHVSPEKYEQYKMPIDQILKSIKIST